jgi:hypothetical protein
VTTSARAGSRSNLLSGRPERHPSSHAGLGRYVSTPPRRSPLRRRSDRHSEPLAHLGGRTLGRSLKRPEVTAGSGQHVSPGALPTGTASAAPRGGDAVPAASASARHLFATPRSRPRLLSRTAARLPASAASSARHRERPVSRWTSPSGAVRSLSLDWPSGPSCPGHRLRAATRRAWHALTRCKRRILPRA